MRLGTHDGAGTRDPESLTDVVDGTLEQARNCEGLRIGQLLDVFSERIYGPLFLLPGLLILVPVVGAIPGVPIVFGVLVFIVSAQLLFGRNYPWVPGALVRREVPGPKVETALEKIRPWASRIDGLLRPRLEAAFHAPVVQVVALASLGLAVSTVPLAVVPWGVTAPGLALCCFGLGFTTRDGALVLAGLVLVGLTVVFVVTGVTGLGG